jgi:uncharacterized OsmC-like protein
MTQSYKTAFDGTQETLRAEPEQALATFTAESRQAEGLRSDVQVRQFGLTVDEPEALGGTDQGPNPVELVLAALASCQEITYRLYADSLGIPLNSVSVKVSGDLDLRGFFAVDQTGGPGFQAIRAEVTLDSQASEAELDRLRATVDQFCPVLDILGNKTPVSLTFVEGDRAQPQAAE